MAFSFSVWLHETARLYLRYAAVGLVGIPLALLYALARRAAWNTTVVTGTLIVLGFVGAFFLWRRLGDWKFVSTATVRAADVTSDAWADLINTASRTTVTHQQMTLCFQQSVRADEEQLRAWNLLLTPHHSRLSHSVEVAEVADAVIKNLTQQAMETEQENYKQPATEPTRQRQPAWAFALNGQTQKAHALA